MGWRRRSARFLDHLDDLPGWMASLKAFGLMISCSGQNESRATPAPESRTTPVATPPVAAPTGAQVLTGGCGTTENYEGGSLPDWAWSTQVSFDGDDSGRTASELQRWI